jgi:hypothetical protein
MRCISFLAGRYNALIHVSQHITNTDYLIIETNVSNVATKI